MAAAERGDGHEPHLYTRRDVFATKADHLQSGWPPDRVTEADVLGGRRGEFESVWCVLLSTEMFADVPQCTPFERATRTKTPRRGPGTPRCSRRKAMDSPLNVATPWLNSAVVLPRRATSGPGSLGQP